MKAYAIKINGKYLAFKNKNTESPDGIMGHYYNFYRRAEEAKAFPNEFVGSFKVSNDLNVIKIWKTKGFAQAYIDNRIDFWKYGDFGGWRMTQAKPFRKLNLAALKQMIIEEIEVPDDRKEGTLYKVSFIHDSAKKHWYNSMNKNYFKRKYIDTLGFKVDTKGNSGTHCRSCGLIKSKGIPFVKIGTAQFCVFCAQEVAEQTKSYYNSLPEEARDNINGERFLRRLQNTK